MQNKELTLAVVNLCNKILLEKNTCSSQKMNEKELRRALQLASIQGVLPIIIEALESLMPDNEKEMFPLKVKWCGSRRIIYNAFH